jgi:hypothetical protein
MTKPKVYKILNIKFSRKAYDDLNTLKYKTGCENFTELLRNAIVLYKYIEDEMSKGHIIIVRDEKNNRERIFIDSRRDRDD